jgi:antitoxin YefM
MDVVYRLKPNEINDDFLRVLKNTFLGKEIAVTVEEIPDETEYLLSTEANRKQLLQAVEDIKNGKCVHTMTIEEMEAMI